MKIICFCYCESCGKSFTGKNSKSVCSSHENKCEKYRVGDRVKVFYKGDDDYDKGRWLSGTIVSIVSVSFKLPGRRSMMVHTDKEYEDNYDGIKSIKHNIDTWEYTEDKKHVRRLVK